MIRLVNYKCNKGGQVILLNKSTIGGMFRDNENEVTHLWDNNTHDCSVYIVKETPEEILAMPDIEEGSKDIDWEQRRYEIAKHILPQMSIIQPITAVKHAVHYADALIKELKEGGDKCI